MNIQYFISQAEFFEYWSLVSQYVNVGSIFLWGFLGGLLGAVVVVIAEIVWRKKILVRRKYKFLKFLAYLYFAFFPLFAGFCFTQWFAFHNIEKQVVKNIPNILAGSNELFDTYLKESIEDMVGKENLKLSANQLVDSGMDKVGSTIKSMATDSDSITLKERSMALVASNVVQSNLAKGKAKSKIAETIGENTLVGNDLAEELMATEMASILETGAVNFVVEQKVKGIFGGLKMQALLIFLIGMTIPIAEIVLAHYLERKRIRELEPEQNDPL